MLSYPCERNSVSLQNDPYARNMRRKRELEYEARRTQALVQIEKGKVDTTLGERVREATPAFCSPPPIWTQYGPNGYPSTPSYLIANRSYFDGSDLAFTSVGNGLVG